MATAAPTRPVAYGDDITGLKAVSDPGCALAIWDRALPPSLAGLVAALDLADVDDIDALLPAADATVAAAVLLGAAGYEGKTAAALAHEIAALADALAAVTIAKRLRLRLEVVDTDACRRFHADLVTIRLLVTLRGPGTQWIDTAAPDVVEQLPAGAVGLFKGRRLMDEPTVLHRSPPIAGTGVHRLMLVIDPA